MQDLLDGSGTEGSGQVTSLSMSGQSSRIWLYRYHCCSTDIDLGQITVGRSVGPGAQGAFIRLRLCEQCEVSHCSLMCTTPGVVESKRKWWCFLIPTIFFNLVAKKSVQLYTGTIVLQDTS